MKRTAASSRVGRALTRAWYESHPAWHRQVLLGLLAPAEWAFDAAGRLRGAAYDRGWVKARRVGVPVISVGNLAVGGAGKTPVVIALAERLTAAGHRVAVLSRGYGASSKVARVVAAGDGPSLVADEAGDEPHLVARRCPGALVLAGPDRAALAERAVEDHGATVILLDDGLQHRRLARDLDVVVVDASDPLGNGHLLPRGPLREGPRALARTHLLWLSRVDEISDRPWAAGAQLTALVGAAGGRVVRSRYRAVSLIGAGGAEPEPASALRGRRVVALAGVARPKSFLRTLAGLGAQVVGERLFPDHHPFTPAELDEAARSAREIGARLVATEKDASRLPPGADVDVLRIEVEVVDGGELLEEVLQDLAAAAPPAGAVA